MRAERSTTEAVRLKRTRRWLRGYFLGSGIIPAFHYPTVAGFRISIFGVKLTRYWPTTILAAVAFIAGTYVVALFV